MESANLTLRPAESLFSFEQIRLGLTTVYNLGTGGKAATISNALFLFPRSKVWAAWMATSFSRSVSVGYQLPKDIRYMRSFAEYPAMSDMDSCRRLVRDCGYNLLGDFVLREVAWWDDYYRPMEKRLAELIPK